MIDQKLINRLNELSKISKTRELTENEKKERDELRAIYLKQFRQGFMQTLDNVKVVDSKGNDIFKGQNFKNISATATDEDLVELSDAIEGILENRITTIKKVQTYVVSRV